MGPADSRSRSRSARFRCSRPGRFLEARGKTTFFLRPALIDLSGAHRASFKYGGTRDFSDSVYLVYWHARFNLPHPCPCTQNLLRLVERDPVAVAASLWPDLRNPSGFSSPLHSHDTDLKSFTAHDPPDGPPRLPDDSEGNTSSAGRASRAAPSPSLKRSYNVTVFQQAAVASGIALSIGAGLLFLLGERLRWTHWLISLVGGAATFGAAVRLHAVLMNGGLPFGACVALGVFATAAVAAAFPHWTSVGHLAFTTVILASAAFVSYAVYVIVHAHLGPLSLAFAALLLLLQAAALVLLLAHTFEIVDVICRVSWRRRREAQRVDGFAPMVSLHVPTHNEPPEMVVETLDALARLDYPAFEVLVIDNNTAEEDLWRPVEEHCRRLGPRFRFFHLLPWPGFKSGALNFALRQTAPEAELIGIVDADYVVEPNFLSDLVGHFHDPKVRNAPFGYASPWK